MNAPISEATEAIAAIAAGLRAAYDGDPQSATLSPNVVVRRASLESGRAGAALFFAYRAAATADESDRDYSARLLHDAITVSDTQVSRGLLHHGAIGVAWAVVHLQSRLSLDQARDPALGRQTTSFVEAVDRAVLARVSVSPWTEDYDLISGLVGFGLYALERLPEACAVRTIEQIVARLGELAEQTPDGITWWTSPALTYRPDLAPNGWYNLGVAHGVPGIVGLLAQVVVADVAVDRARELFEGAVRWLRAQQLSPESGSHFPAWVLPGVEPTPGRQAWCYGDLGIASTLLMAARLLHDASLEESARQIAVSVATAPFRPDTVDEPVFCHGAIGNAHLFRRLHETLGDGVLQTAATDSLARGLRMRRPGGILGGFAALEYDDTGRRRRVAYRGLLNGAAGIGLALLAATTPVEPAWDRLFLISPVHPARATRGR